MKHVALILSVLEAGPQPSKRATHLQVLDFMRDYQRQNDNMPTIKEITAHFGWGSPHSAICHLYTLEKRGHIECIPGRRSKYRFKRTATK